MKKTKQKSRSGPALTEDAHTERGWTRLSLRLPPAETEALDALLLEGESRGLAVRRLLLAAAKKRAK